MSVYPDRLRHNAEVLRRAYGPRMIAVIKGDGYGLGLVTCAAALASAGVRVMAVGSIVEAARVRAAGVNVRLIVLDSEGLALPSTGIEAEWLVACDGVRSTVRHMLGLPFEGEVFHEGLGGGAS